MFYDLFSMVSGISPTDNTFRADTEKVQRGEGNGASKQPGVAVVRRLPRVSEYMDDHVPTLEPSMTILEAIDFLLEHRVTGAPVVLNDKVIGKVTEKDCLNVLAGGDGECALAKRTVKDYMNTDVVCVPPHMDIYYAAGMFLNNNSRRLLVVEDGKLVGAITRFDILRAIQAGLR
jgi:predicted transcriptional regulator